MNISVHTYVYINGGEAYMYLSSYHICLYRAAKNTYVDGSINPPNK